MNQPTDQPQAPTPPAGKAPYEPPAIIYEGELTTRAGTQDPDGFGADRGKTAEDLFG